MLKKAATVFTKLTKYRVFISKGKAGLVIMLQKDYDKVDEDDNYPSAVSLIEGIGLVTVNLAS